MFYIEVVIWICNNVLHLSGGGGGGIERCRCFCDTLMSMSEKGRVGVGDLDRLEVRLP